jgi:predicted lipid-binding transport protein (Tim44 family)
MQELIDRIVATTGLSPEVAEKATGIMLSLVRNQGDKNKVEQLFAAVPGAAELAAQHGGDGAKGGGLLGMLGGGLMGGPLAAVTKLQAAGLNMNQIKTLGKETLGYAEEKAGKDLVRDVANSIPGISSYL